MDAVPDPFVHHPELRDEIVDPGQSFSRTLSIASLSAKLKELGLPLDWWYPDEVREALRAETLESRRDGDLWVFGYGSLLWDPGFYFDEVRRAHLPGYARRFILKDCLGARGTVEKPGLMAALDSGEGCDGLLFRIACARVEEETEVLWRREVIAPAYTAHFVDAYADDQAITALTFVADHEADMIAADLSREEQIRFLATGTGFLGSSLDYLRNIARKFAVLGIHDEEVDSLLREAEAYVHAG